MIARVLGLTVVVCLCVCMSAWIKLLFAFRLPSIYATPCFIEIRIISPEIKVLPSETLSQTMDNSVRHSGHWRVRYKQSQRAFWCGQHLAATRQTRQVSSTSTTDRRLLITLDAQFCVQRNGRLGLRRRRSAGPIIVSWYTGFNLQIMLDSVISRRVAIISL